MDDPLDYPPFTPFEFVTGLVGLCVALAVIVVLIKTVARFMGLTIGILRAGMCGFGGVVIAGMTVGPSMNQHDDDSPGFAVFLGVVFVSMLVLVAVTEAVNPGKGGLIGITRALLRRLGRARRYSQITTIAVRHGLGGFLAGRSHPRGSSAALARSLRLALEQGGVTFVKLGQVLSTRRDLFGPEVIAELSQLQDDVAPVGWDLIAPQLTRDLGQPVDAAFAEFDTTPIAAASIAQVYRAKLHSGEAVVVKVRRPDISRQVERDLDIVARLARTLHKRAVWARRIGVTALAAGFAEALREELDFRVEARNLAAVAAAGRPIPSEAGVDAVVLPAVHRQFGAERVLVMQYLDGGPIGDGNALSAHGIDPDRLARSLLQCLLRQILVDGIFHADPHPGNIMLLRDGRIALIDYGSVGRIDAGIQTCLQQILLAIDQRDPAALHDGLAEIMERTDEGDSETLERALGRFMARHLSAGLAPDAGMFTDLFKLVSAHGVALPPEIAAVFRALATIEGTLTDLVPGFHLVEEAKAFATREFAELMAPASLKDAAAEELRAMMPALRRIPRRIERISAALEHGRLSTNVRLFADSRDRAVVAGFLGQALLTVLAATTGIMSVMLLSSEAGPFVAENIRLYQVFGYLLLVVSTVLMVRVLVGIFTQVR